MKQKNQAITGTNYKKGFSYFQMTRVRIMNKCEVRVFEYTIDRVPN